MVISLQYLIFLISVINEVQFTSASTGILQGQRETVGQIMTHDSGCLHLCGSLQRERSKSEDESTFLYQ